ncbi:rolling circle replication-associated protein [Campylobacter pinnipediorum]|nr:replication endonuclease [Campylobacter pinnipediorum]
MFGVTDNDLKFCQSKMDNQKNYLLNHQFVNNLGEIKSLFDISMSANFSSKYYAEVTNRVNTIYSLSNDNLLSPVFLTITLNGCFRDALKGDYSRFKAKDYKYLPYDVKYKAKNQATLTINDLIKVLNHQWNLFIMRFRKNFKGSQSSYIRCFEPHKSDGVPHIHALFYTDKNNFDFMLKIYRDIFYAPQNLRKNAITKEQIMNNEINGFQTSIYNASGYVMKYIQKTFINVDKTDKLDELSCWYVKHKVRRFITSRTKVPLWVYRKINFISTFKDFHHLNDMKNDDNFFLEWNKEDDYINIKIPRNKEELIYLNGRLEHYIKDNLINSYDFEKQEKKKENLRIKLPDSVDVTINHLSRQAEKNRYLANYNKNKPLNRKKDFELISYYESLDKQNCNLQHLAYTENLLIDRDMSFVSNNDKKHDLNNPLVEDFIIRDLRNYEF